jgi:hypothetical protein
LGPCAKVPRDRSCTHAVEDQAGRPFEGYPVYYVTVGPGLVPSVCSFNCTSPTCGAGLGTRLEKAGPVIRIPLANVARVRGEQSATFRCIPNLLIAGGGVRAVVCVIIAAQRLHRHGPKVYWPSLVITVYGFKEKSSATPRRVLGSCLLSRCTEKLRFSGP